MDICTDVSCSHDEYCFAYRPDEARCVKKPNYELSRPSRERLHSWREEKDRESGEYVLKQNYNNSRIVQCPACPINSQRSAFETVCGSDNRTYSSPCRLEFHNCIHNTKTQLSCRGSCPCTGARDWKHSKNTPVYGRIHRTLPRKAHKNDVLQPKVWSKQDCNEQSLLTMGQRLRAWFAVVADEQVRRDQNSKRRLDDGDNARNSITLPVPGCEFSAAVMFQHFDIDKNGRLSSKELYYLDHDNAEKCLEPYLERCDRDSNRLLTGQEWCDCFASNGKFQNFHLSFKIQKQHKILNFI